MNIRTVTGWREREYQAKHQRHIAQWEKAKRDRNASQLGVKARKEKTK